MMMMCIRMSSLNLLAFNGLLLLLSLTGVCRSAEIKSSSSSVDDAKIDPSAPVQQQQQQRLDALDADLRRMEERLAMLELFFDNSFATQMDGSETQFPLEVDDESFAQQPPMDKRLSSFKGLRGKRGGDDDDRQQGLEEAARRLSLNAKSAWAASSGGLKRFAFVGSRGKKALTFSRG